MSHAKNIIDALGGISRLRGTIGAYAFMELENGRGMSFLFSRPEEESPVQVVIFVRVPAATLTFHDHYRIELTAPGATMREQDFVQGRHLREVFEKLAGVKL